MENKSILICTLFSGNTNSGASKNAFHFANHMQNEMNIRVKIMTLDLSNGLFSRKIIKGLNYCRINIHTKNIFSKILSCIYLVPIYIINILKHQYILIYGNGFWTYEFIIIFGKLFARKIIFRSTTLGIDDARSILSHKYLGKIRINLLKNISVYFAINPEFTKSWVYLFNNNTKIFESPQGVDINLFKPPTDTEKKALRTKLKFPLNKLIFLSVGHIINRKGYREVFKTLSELDFDFLYLIVGEIFSEKQSQDLISLGKSVLKKRVFFTGPKWNIWDYYKIADIFILNSTQEGTPNVLLEAMSTGLPICVSNLAGLTNYITFDRFNALIHSNQDELKSNVDFLKDNPMDRILLGENARKWVVNNCSFQLVIERMLKKVNY